MPDWLQIVEFAFDVTTTILAVMLIFMINIGLKWLPARNQMTLFLGLFLLVNFVTMALGILGTSFTYQMYVLILPVILLVGPIMTRSTESTLTMRPHSWLSKKAGGLYLFGLTLISPYLVMPMSVTTLPHDERPWYLVLGVNSFVVLFVLSSGFHFMRMFLRFYQGELYCAGYSENLYLWTKRVWASMSLIWLTLLFNTITSVIDIPWHNLSLSVGIFDMITSVITTFVLISLTLFTVIYCKKPSEQLETQVPDKYEKSALSKAQADKILSLIDDAMQSHSYFLDSTLNVEKLAKIVATPSQYLSQAINQYRGINFYELIANYRINYAKELLLNHPEKTVATIAMDAGFNAKSTFNQTFKKLTGFTPSEFKKNHLTMELRAKSR